jgi:hypothetical protein
MLTSVMEHPAILIGMPQAEMNDGSPSFSRNRMPFDAITFDHIVP